MKKIESLNESQTLALSEYRDKWIKIGLSTEPANRPEAEKAIKELYKLAVTSQFKKKTGLVTWFVPLKINHHATKH